MRSARMSVARRGQDNKQRTKDAQLGVLRDLILQASQQAAQFLRARGWVVAGWWLGCGWVAVGNLNGLSVAVVSELSQRVESRSYEVPAMQGVCVC
jgi:hypothetical protein